MKKFPGPAFYLKAREVCSEPVLEWGGRTPEPQPGSSRKANELKTLHVLRQPNHVQACKWLDLHIPMPTGTQIGTADSHFQ